MCVERQINPTYMGHYMGNANLVLFSCSKNCVEKLEEVQGREKHIFRTGKIIIFGDELFVYKEEY